MRKYCYFLAYRQKPSRRGVNWLRPTGGLVVEPARFVEDFPVSDFQGAAQILKERYHCSPYEELIVAEVFEEEEMRMAKRLDRKWHQDTAQFAEIMKASY